MLRLTNICFIVLLMLVYAACDTAGNVDATPATYTWTVAVAPLDTTAPTSSPTATATAATSC